MKSFLRWAGSKKQSLTILKSYWSEEYKRYVEPFAGSACLFFEIEPTEALIGDMNRELINTYKSITLSALRVYTILSSYSPDATSYYLIRSLDTNNLDRFERAARFIYLNRYCFNGLYRTNLQGKFNVPYGGGKSGSIPSYADLLNYRKILLRAELIPGDFSLVLDQVVQGDFVYIDPPYSIKNRRVFKEYDISIFSELDLKRLRLYLEKFDNEGIPFLVSYSDSEEANILSKGFKTDYTKIRRNIAGFTGHRKQDTEVLISNFKITSL